MKAQTNEDIRRSQVQRGLRSNPTDAEKALWQRLRARQIEDCKFRRQHPFLDYVLDFVCLEKWLVVEVDGGQHLESERDRIRDKRLVEAGFRVLRFWNNEVLGQMDAVLEVIREALMAEPHPHPNPPLEGEGTPRSDLCEENKVSAAFLPPLQGEGRGGDGGEINAGAEAISNTNTAPGAPQC